MHLFRLCDYYQGALHSLHWAMLAMLLQALMGKVLCALVTGKDPSLHVFLLVGWKIKLHSLWEMPVSERFI